MSKASAKSSGSKPAPFKKQGKGAFNTIQTKPGDNKQQLANIKQLASNYGAPKQAKTITVDPKNRNKQTLANMKLLGTLDTTSGDNPYKG